MARLIRQSLPEPPAAYDQAYLSKLVNAVNMFMLQTTAQAEVVAARFICTDPVWIPPHLPDTSTLPTGMLYLKRINGVMAVHGELANPAGTSNTVYTMMGLGLAFSPLQSTRVTFVLDGQMGNAVNNGITTVTLMWGVGPPPAHGTLASAIAGTPLGQPVEFRSEAAGMMVPFSQTVLLTGLEVGVQYWIDAAVLVSAGSTSILTNLQITGTGIFDSPGSYWTIVQKEDP